MSIVLWVSMEQLRTTLAPLRGEHTDRQNDLAPLPIRVAQSPGGTFEIIDGFKRLIVWKSEGRREVPVVVEPVSGIARKARILEANAPRKTAGPMDEARVVASLADEDQLTPTAIAKLLGRKKTWVTRRLMLARRLAPELGFRLDHGRLSLTVACALCGFDGRMQMRLAGAVTRHGLTSREAEAFFTTYRLAPDVATRESLLRDPRSAQRRLPVPAASPLGSTAAQIEARFDSLEESLNELSASDFSGLSDAEKRVLEARKRGLLQKILKLADQIKEVSHESRREETHSGPGRDGHVDPGHCPETQPGCENHPACPQPATPETHRVQTRSIQGDDPGNGPERVQGPSHPPGDPGPGVQGLPDDHPEVPPEEARAPEDPSQGLPPVRNSSSLGGSNRLEPLQGTHRRSPDPGALLLHDPLLLADALHRLLPKREAPDPPSRPCGGVPLLPGPMPP